MSRSRNIHGYKLIFSIWLNQQSVLYYKLLKLNEIATADVYKHQFKKLKSELCKKRPIIASNKRKSFFYMITPGQILKKLQRNTIVSQIGNPSTSSILTRNSAFRLLFIQIDAARPVWYRSNVEDVQKQVDEWVETDSLYCDGIAKLPERWGKVIKII